MSQSASFGPITIHPMAYLRGGDRTKEKPRRSGPSTAPPFLILGSSFTPSFLSRLLCLQYCAVQYRKYLTCGGLLRLLRSFWVPSRGGYLGSASSWSSLPPLSTSYHGACACACPPCPPVLSLVRRINCCQSKAMHF